MLLGDTMGELLFLYALADNAFVGGSLVPNGGHNLLEPAALAKPVLSGPHLFNFLEIAAMLRNAGALQEISAAGPQHGRCRAGSDEGQSGSFAALAGRDRAVDGQTLNRRALSVTHKPCSR